MVTLESANLLYIGRRFGRRVQGSKCGRYARVCMCYMVKVLYIIRLLKNYVRRMVQNQHRILAWLLPWQHQMCWMVELLLEGMRRRIDKPAKKRARYRWRRERRRKKKKKQDSEVGRGEGWRKTFMWKSKIRSKHRCGSKLGHAGDGTLTHVLG